jgi:hypothetical protein
VAAPAADVSLGERFVVATETQFGLGHVCFAGVRRSAYGLPKMVSGQIALDENVSISNFIGAGWPDRPDPPTDPLSFTLLLGALKAA